MLSKTGLPVDGHFSQIQALTPAGRPVCEEKNRGRRTGVREGDSEYIKLAKQGGHKDLLWHEESSPRKTNSSKPVDWFCPESEGNTKPSLISSEDMKHLGAFQRPKPPFGSDSMSTWERGESTNSHQKTAPWPGPCEGTSKFKRKILDKKQSPVNMSKLLSFGYAKDERGAHQRFSDKLEDGH